MSIIGKPLIVGGGGVNKYFQVTDTNSNGGTIRDIELVDGTVNIQSVKTVSTPYTSNGTYSILPDSGYDAFEQANIMIGMASTDGIIQRTIGGAYINSVVSFIETCTFYSCTSLTTVSFPNCISIDFSAFQNCNNLMSVSFPECTVIYNSAFADCSALIIASFPKCTSIHSCAFENCTDLTTALFPECTNIGSVATLFTEGSVFANCTALTTISFPKCTTIGASAFDHCTSLITASFPNCITIGTSAFKDCYNLISLYLMNSSVCTLSNSNAFSSTPIAGYSFVAGRYGSIYVPSSLLTSYKTATNWSSFSNRFIGI